MFENGSEVLRLDCHLHTNKDKEFDYSGEDNQFINDYITKMKAENISVGIITNHNKFDYEQYKTLKKAAWKNDIFILPGVELSVKEGASAIHVLIIFNPNEWIINGVDHISRIIEAFFLGVDDPGNENTCTEKDLLTVIQELDKQNKDYFMIFAHVEQKKGFWNECGGALIEKLASNESFKRRALGFQKVRSRNLIKKVHNWMGYDLAFVEGSDPKKIADIGKGDKKTYIKIGEASYDAVKYALLDYENRVYSEKPKIKHGYIKKMTCTGGKLDGKVFTPSHELNTLIGIRGSGKSSVLEVLRYALDKTPTQDQKYKNDLVSSVLGSGGMVELELIDEFGKKYYLKRIFGDAPELFDEGKSKSPILLDSIIKSPLYFGQKDLALTRKGYEYDLLNKLIGDKAPQIDKELNTIQEKILSGLSELKTLSDIPAQIDEITSESQILEHKLNIYQEKGVAEKLEKQTSCDADLVKLNTLLEWLDTRLALLNSANTYNKDDLLSLSNYVSQYNSEIFGELNQYIQQTNMGLDSINRDIEIIKQAIEGVKAVKKKLEDKIDSLKDEFARIKREINDEQLDADSYVADKKTLAENKEKVLKLEESLKSKSDLCERIQVLFNSRNELLKNRFLSYKNASKEINSQQKNLAVDIDFKGDKDRLKETMSSIFRGTSLTDAKYTEMSQEFEDLSDLVEDYFIKEGTRINKICTNPSVYSKVASKIEDLYIEMVKEEIPDKITIKYHGKLLSKHSLGQRASALMLFILTQHDSDVIIVDQPEDDLDNQVIYEELIQTIKKEKKNMQFIFATHNANIPVLGDAERVITTQYNEDETIDIKCGTIDSAATHLDIVNIMEGGKEAFKKRNEIYVAWR